MTPTMEDVRPETLHKLAVLATAGGFTSIDEFVERVWPLPVNGQVEEKPFYETATADEWVAELRTWAESHDPGIPALSLEDVSRESIYEDRF